MATAQQPPGMTTGQFISNGTDTPYFGESLSTAMADMIARMKGVEPTHEGFRLYEYLNPDAVDSLFEHANRHEEASWKLTFNTGDQAVVVRSDGFIRVRRTG